MMPDFKHGIVVIKRSMHVEAGQNYVSTIQLLLSAFSNLSTVVKVPGNVQSTNTVSQSDISCHSCEKTSNFRI